MFDSSTYQRRRQALRDKVQNGIILILGNNEAPANYPDNTYKFRQDSSFLFRSFPPRICRRNGYRSRRRLFLRK